MHIKPLRAPGRVQVSKADLSDLRLQLLWLGMSAVGIYRDVMGGVRASRLASYSLGNDVRERKVDCLLVLKLDRLVDSQRNR